MRVGYRLVIVLREDNYSMHGSLSKARHKEMKEGEQSYGKCMATFDLFFQLGRLYKPHFKYPQHTTKAGQRSSPSPPSSTGLSLVSPINPLIFHHKSTYWRKPQKKKRTSEKIGGVWVLEYLSLISTTRVNPCHRDTISRDLITRPTDQ